MKRYLVERRTYRLQCAWLLAATSAKRVKKDTTVILAVDFHFGFDKGQLDHTHFRHSNGNHNGYPQFEAKFVIFRILKFPRVRWLCTINRLRGILDHFSMAYLLSKIFTKNYWNRTTIVEIIDGCWVISFFETQCMYILLQCGLIILQTFMTPILQLVDHYRIKYLIKGVVAC